MRGVMAVVAMVAALSSRAVAAEGSIWDLEPMIWKAVRALPGERPWSTCRRHFRWDATRVRPGPPGIVYCYVPYHYIYGPGEVRRNFNN